MCTLIEKTFIGLPVKFDRRSDVLEADALTEENHEVKSYSVGYLIQRVIFPLYGYKN